MVSAIQRLVGVGKTTNQARLLLQWKIAIVDLEGSLICLLEIYIILNYKFKNKSVKK